MSEPAPIPRSRTVVSELMEARELIGPSIAALAATRASNEDIRALREAVRRLRASKTDAKGFVEAEFEFHLSLARAAENTYLLQALGDLRARFTPDMDGVVAAAIGRFGCLESSIAAYGALVDALKARDSRRAHRIFLDLMIRQHQLVIGLQGHCPGQSDAAGHPGRSRSTPTAARVAERGT